MFPATPISTELTSRPIAERDEPQDVAEFSSHAAIKLALSTSMMRPRLMRLPRLALSTRRSATIDEWLAAEKVEAIPFSKSRAQMDSGVIARLATL